VSNNGHFEPDERTPVDPKWLELQIPPFGRQRGLRLGRSGFLRYDAGGGNLAEGELAPQQFKRLGPDLYDSPRRWDLRAQSGLLRR
jgi:hypothetical protein